jgi:hypothetical protein
MAKTKRKTKTETPEKVEESTSEQEPSVTLVEPVIPESPTEESVPVTEESPKVDEESTAEAVVSEIAEGMVTAKVIGRNISFIDFVDGTIKHYKIGETFTSTKERVDSLDQRYIKIV